MPRLVQLQRQVEDHSTTNWEYFTAQEPSYSTNISAKIDKETQTYTQPQIVLREAGAQYKFTV